MKLVIEIDLDGAAFEGEDEESRNGDEVARILGKVAREFSGTEFGEEFIMPLRDAFGNKVGYAEAEED